MQNRTVIVASLRDLESKWMHRDTPVGSSRNARRRHNAKRWDLVLNRLHHQLHDDFAARNIPNPRQHADQFIKEMVWMAWDACSADFWSDLFAHVTTEMRIAVPLRVHTSRLCGPGRQGRGKPVRRIELRVA